MSVCVRVRACVYVCVHVCVFAGSLVLCIMASYCFRICRKQRYRDGNSFGSSSRNNGGNNNTNGRYQDPFVNNQNSTLRNQRRQRRYERMRGYSNNGQVSGLGHQYYPSATNPYAQVSKLAHVATYINVVK